MMRFSGLDPEIVSDAANWRTPAWNNRLWACPEKAAYGRLLPVADVLRYSHHESPSRINRGYGGLKSVK